MPPLDRLLVRRADRLAARPTDAEIVQRLARRNRVGRARRRGLDHPFDHPDDPTGPVWIRRDRRGTKPEQPRSDWSRPDRRGAPGYGSGGWASIPSRKSPMPSVRVSRLEWSIAYLRDRSRPTADSRLEQAGAVWRLCQLRRTVETIWASAAPAGTPVSLVNQQEA
jgi:hypothetical protein